MTPNMAPFIALAWAISAAALGGYVGWALWRFQKRNG